MNALITDPRFESLTTAVLGWVGNAVLFGTALALVTWLILKLVGRRLHPALHGLFWMIVLVKFLLPVGPSWSYSLSSGVRALSRSWAAIAPSSPARVAPDAGATDVLIVNEVNRTASSAASSTPSAPPRIPLAAIIAAVYCIGASIVLGLRLAAYLRFAQHCHKLPHADAATRAAVEAACQRLGVRRAPDVRVSEDSPAPFIFGFARPVLVLSRRHLQNAEELEAVILHEIAHLRRGDLFVRYLQWSAGTLLFFWPVVAWVNRRIDLAREHACDEWALRHGRLTAGAYARCLLDAVHSASARRFTYRPAAMAANVFTVKRRIEMILESTPSRNRAAFGIPSLIAALAWSSFALSGFAAAGDPAPSAGEPLQKKVVVVTANGDPDNVEVQVNNADGDKPCVWFDKKTGAGEAMKVHMARFGIPSEKELTAFLAAHPTADANADGKLSISERNAFLVAIAMSNTAGVLQQFPDADLDGNGTLEANEAGQLVGGGMFIRRVEGENPGETRENVMMYRVAVRTGGTPAKDAPKMPTTSPREAATWLVDNAKAEPTAAEVAQFVVVVEQAPFAQILKDHPEADTDGDGKLSPAEHEALMATEQAHVGKILFKHFPEADTNGDGIISREEMRNLKGSRKIVLKTSNGGTTTDEKVQVNGDQQEHEVIILRDDAGDSNEK